jgi:hypothetical protein
LFIYPVWYQILHYKLCVAAGQKAKAGKGDQTVASCRSQKKEGGIFSAVSKYVKSFQGLRAE